MPNGKWVSKENLQTFWQMVKSNLAAFVTEDVNNVLPTIVPEELNKVLPTMVGEQIDNKFGDDIGDNVTSWLNDHVTPAGSAVVVDDTLTIEGAAADAKKTGDEISGLKEDLQLNFDDLRTTNRVFDSLSETVSGSGAYVLKEIPFDGSEGIYYGTIQSSEGGTAGNFAAYLAAFDSNNNRLAQVVFSTTYPATCNLSAPANTVVIKLRLFATLATSESNKNVTFNDIHVLKGSASVDITLKDNVKIPSVVELENSIYGDSISATKTFTGAGETSLDITTNIEMGKTYYIELENTNLTGHVQIYGYNDSYISLIHLTLQGNNKYAFEATADYSKIRCHYIISAVGNSPSSKVTIKTRPIYEGNDNNIIHVGADCEYTSIQDAIDECSDSADKPFIIFIHNGEYSEFSTYDNDQRVRYISFIGESRCGVIVRGDKGTYAEPTAEISSNGAVRNITFIQETSAETQEPEGRFPYCYAVHDDYFGADTEYENCTFISNAGPAVGMGLKANKSKAFRNCTFINNGDGTFGSIGIGAFFGHSESANNSENQELIIENCTAINKTGANGLYLSLVTSVSGATFKGVNIRNCGSFGNGQPSAQCTLPLSYSYGNNVDSLNVI